MRGKKNQKNLFMEMCKNKKTADPFL